VQLTQLKLAADPEALSALEEIQTLTEQSIQDLCGVIRALRPLYLENLGLVAALKMLAQETTENAGFPIEFNQAGVEKRFPSETELALYRMTQEGTSNILRHARASKASLKIAFTTDGIVLTITDNGCGFVIPENPAEFAPSGHFGLLGIYERSELIGAQVEIRSTMGEGTQLEIRLSCE